MRMKAFFLVAILIVLAAACGGKQNAPAVQAKTVVAPPQFHVPEPQVKPGPPAVAHGIQPLTPFSAKDLGRISGQSLQPCSDYFALGTVEQKPAITFVIMSNEDEQRHANAMMISEQRVQVVVADQPVPTAEFVNPESVQGVVILHLSQEDYAAARSCLPAPSLVYARPGQLPAQGEKTLRDLSGAKLNPEVDVAYGKYLIYHPQGHGDGRGPTLECHFQSGNGNDGVFLLLRDKFHVLLDDSRSTPTAELVMDRDGYVSSVILRMSKKDYADVKACLPHADPAPVDPHKADV